MSCRSGKGDSPEKFRSRSEDHHQKEPSRYSFRHDYLQYCFIVFKFYLIYITICNGFFFSFLALLFAQTPPSWPLFSPTCYLILYGSYTAVTKESWYLNTFGKHVIFLSICYFPVGLLSCLPDLERLVLDLWKNQLPTAWFPMETWLPKGNEESTDEVEKLPYFLLEWLGVVKSLAGKALCKLRNAILLTVPDCIL